LISSRSSRFACVRFARAEWPLAWLSRDRERCYGSILKYSFGGYTYAARVEWLHCQEEIIIASDAKPVHARRHWL
jgi:hypothetical protein